MSLCERRDFGQCRNEMMRELREWGLTDHDEQPNVVSHYSSQLIGL
jgi:hypothetical protein